ncbi:MAG TPA: AAA family ATPase, partial [Polyangiaceae bacterium]|nr:AAA family ATPase [Polyangiaceae bacterium]
MKVGIMQGSLREFDLAQVLQVVGLGRQYTGVELSLGGGRTGTIFVKSGQVVSASEGEQQGRDAFRDLFRSNEGDFFVFRQDTPPELPEPLGTLDVLLLDALTERSNAFFERPSSPVNEQATHPGVAPPHYSAPLPPLRAPNVAVTPEPEAPPARVNVAPLPAPVAAAPVHVAPAPAAPVHVAPVAAAPVQVAPAAPVPAPSVPPRKAAPATFGSRPPAFAAAAGDGKIVAFASPKGGSGKSTISLNTALSLARRGHSVILVDGDVNGDVLSAIDARGRARAGALDVVSGSARIEDALMDTVLTRFKLMPAVGPKLPDLDALSVDANGRWSALLGDLANRADVVVVDTPAGMFGVTRAILRASTHVVGVLQAEVLAARSFTRFAEGLATIPEEQRPAVIGVVLNMLQTRHHASLGVFQDALADLPSAWLFDT